jgi:hypothetical protein
MRRREFIAALAGAAVGSPSRRRNCMRSFAIAGAVLVALSVLAQPLPMRQASSETGRGLRTPQPRSARALAIPHRATRR